MCSQKYWALIHAYSIDGVAVPGDVDVWRYKQRKINILNRVVKFEKKKQKKKIAEVKVFNLRLCVNNAPPSVYRRSAPKISWTNDTIMKKKKKKNTSLAAHNRGIFCACSSPPSTPSV